MNENSIKHFKIYRYDPEQDEKPYMQEYELDISKVRGKMLLSALEALKEQDPTLTFRRSCREGVCGSDGMNINGANGLACITPLSECVKNNKLVLRPLPALPVIRDLVVDMDQFYKNYERIKPFLQNDKPAPAIERLQSHALARRRSQGHQTGEHHAVQGGGDQVD